MKYLAAFLVILFLFLLFRTKSTAAPVFVAPVTVPGTRQPVSQPNPLSDIMGNGVSDTANTGGPVYSIPRSGNFNDLIVTEEYTG